MPNHFKTTLTDRIRAAGKPYRVETVTTASDPRREREPMIVGYIEHWPCGCRTEPTYAMGSLGSDKRNWFPCRDCRPRGPIAARRESG